MTVSDVDLLRLYIKSHFVCDLLNNKLLPFDTWSTIAASNSDTIEIGHIFKVDLATIASNSAQPNEWYLLNENADTLTRETVSDTLSPDMWGIVKYQIKGNKKGINRLRFVTKMKTPTSEKIVDREVSFYVR